MKNPSNPILVDNSVLIIYLVGKYKKDLLDPKDLIIFKNLEPFLDKRKKYITPQILAEFNSLEKNYGNSSREREEILTYSIPFLKESFEIYIEKEKIIDELYSLSWLGITDIGVLKAKDKIPELILITGDRDLFEQYNGNKKKAIFLDEFYNFVE